MINRKQVNKKPII